MLPIAQPGPLHRKAPSPGRGLRRNCRDPSAGEVWRNAPGPVADRSRMSGSRGITKQPRASIVGRLLDNSTKKSQTLNRFGNTLNDRGVDGRTGTRGYGWRWIPAWGFHTLPRAGVWARGGAALVSKLSKSLT